MPSIFNNTMLSVSKSTCCQKSISHLAEYLTKKCPHCQADFHYNPHNRVETLHNRMTVLFGMTLLTQLGVSLYYLLTLPNPIAVIPMFMLCWFLNGFFDNFLSKDKNANFIRFYSWLYNDYDFDTYEEMPEQNDISYCGGNDYILK
jgi:hypothetical protein